MRFQNNINEAIHEITSYLHELFGSTTFRYIFQIRNALNNRQSFEKTLITFTSLFPFQLNRWELRFLLQTNFSNKTEL